MGIFDNIINRVTKPIVDTAVKSAVAELQKSHESPNVTEIPSAMQIGYGYTGGARRKYQGTVDFDTLRTFSTVYDVARSCINHRKRQINNLEWNIIPKDDKDDPKKYKKQIDLITEFFESPVHGNDFKMFVDKIIEDILVLDAAVLWKDKTYGGGLKELLPVDGSTIRLRVSPDGTIPEPPQVAFEQIIYGEVKNSYTTDEMYYRIMNPRNNTPYGFSPLEGLVLGVDAALRSQMANSQLLSEGTVPEGFFGVPEEWTPDQIKDYQMWFDGIMAGNGMQSSRIKFMPGGKGVGYMPTKKNDEMRYMEFEKWLLLKCCAMFDVQPEAIGFIDNVTKTVGDTQQQMGNERGLIPMANFLKQFFTQVIKNDFDMPELKFEWKGLQVVDNDFELTRNESMLRNGALTINEWRISQGMDPLEAEAASMPLIFTGIGATTLDSVTEKPEPVDPNTDPNGQNNNTDPAGEEIAEMDKWEAKCVSYQKRGKGLPSFKADHIDQPVQRLIEARLSVAKSKDEIKAAFAPFKADATERSLINRALSVNKDISNFKRNKYERIGQSTGKS